MIIFLFAVYIVYLEVISGNNVIIAVIRYDSCNTM